ncbi:MAG: GGDEF domain-containing protein [Candidatus Cloacimonetes bacterium]|nr:GGDEF domain-containing protein [Candidatus Cloacimonadota bacterium]
MNDKAEIFRLSAISPKSESGIKKFVSNLLNPTEKPTDESIENTAMLMAQHQEMIKDPDRMIASVSTVYTIMFDTLISSPRANQGKLYELLVLNEHMPIMDNSHVSQTILGVLYRYLESEPRNTAFFDKLQLLCIYFEIEHIEAAKQLVVDIQKDLDNQSFESQVLFKLCKIRLCEHQEISKQKFVEYLKLIADVFWESGPDAAIYVLLEWFRHISYLKNSKYYEMILGSLYQSLKNKGGLNLVVVGYLLFCLEDHRLDINSKNTLYRTLLAVGYDYMNSMHLQRLHLYAGQNSEFDSVNFYHSVQSFKDSNIHIQRCWQKVIEMSIFLRKHTSPLEYKISMIFLENKVTELSLQNTVRNELFVENIQSNYQKIEYLYKEVDELSLTDALTGLRNRRFMDNNLLQIFALVARHKTQITFAMLDIDWFKKVNDEYGHSAGDLVLRDLAEIFTKFFRKSDIIIRYGGEEFLAILFDIGKNSHDLLEELRQKVEKKSFIYQDKTIKITISIGWRLCVIMDPVGYEVIDRYISEADKALYQAKNDGRNRTVQFIEKNDALSET